MLDHCINGLITPSATDLSFSLGSLETIDISPCHVDVQFGILSEGAIEAAPAGFGRKVDLR